MYSKKRPRRARPVRLDSVPGNGGPHTLEQAQIDMSVKIGELMSALSLLVATTDEIETAAKMGQQHPYALYKRVGPAPSGLVGLDGKLAGKTVIELTGIGMPFPEAVKIRALFHSIARINEVIVELSAADADADPAEPEDGGSA